MGTGQLVCLVLGVLLVSLGGGMLGGRLVAEKTGAVAGQRPTTAAKGVTAAGTKEMPPPQAIAESEGEPERRVIPTEAEAQPAELTTATKVVLPEPLVEQPVAAAVAVGKAPPESGVKYVIQAMSTSSRSDALAARDRIMTEGFPAEISEANLPGRGRWFRVYVGPYETEARTLLALEGVRDIPGFSESFMKEFE
jgi:hypothetical protein